MKQSHRSKYVVHRWEVRHSVSSNNNYHPFQDWVINLCPIESLHVQLFNTAIGGWVFRIRALITEYNVSQVVFMMCLFVEFRILPIRKFYYSPLSPPLGVAAHTKCYCATVYVFRCKLICLHVFGKQVRILVYTVKLTLLMILLQTLAANSMSSVILLSHLHQHIKSNLYYPFQNQMIFCIYDFVL